jgi:hypothetical protein
MIAILIMICVGLAFASLRLDTNRDKFFAGALGAFMYFIVQFIIIAGVNHKSEIFGSSENFIIFYLCFPLIIVAIFYFILRNVLNKNNTSIPEDKVLDEKTD